VNRNESWRIWAIIIGILLVSGLASAVWPWLGNLGAGESTRIAPETEDIVLNIPPLPDTLPGAAGVNEALPDQLGPWHPLLAVAILTGLVLAPIVLTGGLIAGLYTFLDKQANRVKSAADYQAAQVELQKLDKERVKEMRVDHPAPARPKVVGTPRWSTVATVILLILFVYFSAYMITQTVVTESLWDWSNNWINPWLVSPASFISGIAALLTLVASLAIFRGKPAGSVDSAETDYHPVPWGWMWVILSGMLVLGLGLGLIIVFSGPATAG
jgi:hypothetical protein